MAEATHWRSYLTGFHAERAGITEDVLERAFDQAGRTPYDWAADAVPSGTSVLDLACGSGPMHARLNFAGYVGLDRSTAELAAAAARHLPVAQADASRLPLPDGAVDAVVMSMALMLVPLADTLREVTRVLRPGGVFVATVPYHRPLPAADRLRYARLCLALRQSGLSYPNVTSLARAAEVFQVAGLTLLSDQPQGFVCSISSEHIAAQLFDSLYLPDVPPERMEAGRRVVRRWVGSSVTTPIRRFVAQAS